MLKCAIDAVQLAVLLEFKVDVVDRHALAVGEIGDVFDGLQIDCGRFNIDFGH